jgi:GTPase Era involved in 16S rRNA processing
MKITTHPKIVEVMSRATEIQKALNAAGKEDYAKTIEERVSAIQSERFVIGVAGSVNRGKSTLVSGLLGQRDDAYAPINQFPATNVISIFSHSRQSSTNVFFNDGSKKEISEREIRFYCCEAHNNSNEKNVLSIEAQGPFPGLEQGVFLVDTPGAGNALSAMHSQIVLNFLPNADALIFLVTADEPLVESEKRLLQSIRGNNVGKIFFAMNKTDSVDDEELKESIEHNRSILDSVGFSDVTIYPICAKEFLESGTDRGCEQLLEAIESMITNERIALLADRLRQLLDNLSARAISDLKTEAELMSLSEEELKIKQSELAAFKRDIAQHGGVRERAFINAWEKAYATLEEQVIATRNILKKEYAAVIDELNNSRVKTLGQTVHSDVALKLQESLEGPMVQCEAAVNEAQEAYSGNTQRMILQILPSLSPASSMRSENKKTLNILASTVPSFLTAGVAAVTPGVMTGIMTGWVPVAAAASLSPSTWGPAALATVASGVGTATSMALMSFCAPIAVGAVGFAACRGYGRWKEDSEECKNTLKASICTMLDEGCIQIQQQIRNTSKQGYAYVQEFNSRCNETINGLEAQIENLLNQRDSANENDMREVGINMLEQERLQLTAKVDASGTVEAEEDHEISNALSLFSSKVGQ